MSDDPQLPSSASRSRTGNTDLPQAEGAQHEPTVLDYVKSRFSFGRSKLVEIPSLEKVEEQYVRVRPQPTAPRRQDATPVPWLSLAALGLALIAQRQFEPPHPSAAAGTAFYILAFGMLSWAAWRSEWALAPLAESSQSRDPMKMHLIPFLLFALLLIPAFILLGGEEITPGVVLPAPLVTLFNLQDNLFTWFNLLIWLTALALFIGSVWLRHSDVSPSLLRRVRMFLARKEWQFTINRWAVLLLAASLIVVFFRFYHLQQTPGEPFSDHAEKILDIFDISQGKTHIFFPRNTGREAIQMYWTLVVSWIFSTGLSFITLKIATALAGLFTLPYLYLLGCEVANRRVGFLAVLTAGIGYWPNLISRIGLRFPLYPLFVAPLLLYLIRGFRTRNRNDFILAGIFLGLGLNGYTPYRIVPFLVVAAFVLYMLHRQSKGVRDDAFIWLIIVGLTSLIIFLPLMRYAIDNPTMFSLRAFSRLGLQPDPSSNLPSPGPVLPVFLSNLWNTLRMFNWNDGGIWVNSVPYRPALDVVSAALFLIGILLLAVRYARKRHWLDLFLLLSIPILLLPSILSLAFPEENPAMNRTAGAIVPTFLIIGMALDGLITALATSTRRTVAAYGLTAVLLLASAAQNFDLVFSQFDQEYRNGSWNSSEMGTIIQEFGAVYGETDTVWIVPFPYWVDTRLPGVWAGIPNRDFAMQPDNLPGTASIPEAKLFIVKANTQDPKSNDQKSIDLLQQLYPQGSLSLHRSPVAGHDFWIYFIPAK